MNTKSIVSITMLVVGLINFVLTAIGISPLDITGDVVNTLVTSIVSVGGAVGTAWYNLSTTDAAKLCDILLKNIKSGNVDFNEAVKMITQLTSGTTAGAEGTD